MTLSFEALLLASPDDLAKVPFLPHPCPCVAAALLVGAEGACQVPRKGTTRQSWLTWTPPRGSAVSTHGFNGPDRLDLEESTRSWGRRKACPWRFRMDSSAARYESFRRRRCQGQKPASNSCSALTNLLARFLAPRQCLRMPCKFLFDVTLAVLFKEMPVSAQQSSLNVPGLITRSQPGRFWCHVSPGAQKSQCVGDSVSMPSLDEETGKSGNSKCFGKLANRASSQTRLTCPSETAACLNR